MMTIMYYTVLKRPYYQHLQAFLVVRFYGKIDHKPQVIYPLKKP